MMRRPGAERIAALEAQLADRDAEIVDLRARLDAEASHRLSLCADNERFLAEIERLREQHRLAHLDWAAESVKTLELEAEIERLRALMVVHPGCTCRLCSDVRAVREARDGVR